MAAKLLKSERVDGPDGRRVQVLFYEDNTIRFRIYDSPMVLEEAYLTGRKGYTILKVGPKQTL